MTSKSESAIRSHDTLFTQVSIDHNKDQITTITQKLEAQQY